MKTNVTSSTNVESLTNSKIPMVRLNIKHQCPIQYVTIYNDRAEVTRLVRHRFDVSGTYDLVIEGFSPCVELESLYVSGGTGKACTILEVSYQTSFEDVTSECDLTSLEQLILLIYQSLLPSLVATASAVNCLHQRPCRKRPLVSL